MILKLYTVNGLLNQIKIHWKKKNIIMIKFNNEKFKSNDY